MALKEETLAEYTILNIRSPPSVDYEKDLEWICRSLGFLGSRDKERTAYSIFRTLLEAASQSKGLSSDELAQRIGLTRGTMVHHLNKLIKSGLLIHHEGQYKLRGRSLVNTIEEVQRDMNRVFENLAGIARTVDQALGLFFR